MARDAMAVAYRSLSIILSNDVHETSTVPHHTRGKARGSLETDCRNTMYKRTLNRASIFVVPTCGEK